jgi:uncharacterized protein YjiS (DUF1127 family)
VEHAIGYNLGQAAAARPRTESGLGLAVLWAWYRRYLQRQELNGLDDHLLADIGITRAEAELESRKPFWVE